MTRIVTDGFKQAQKRLVHDGCDMEALKNPKDLRALLLLELRIKTKPSPQAIVFKEILRLRSPTSCAIWLHPGSRLHTGIIGMHEKRGCQLYGSSRTSPQRLCYSFFSSGESQMLSVAKYVGAILTSLRT